MLHALSSLARQTSSEKDWLLHFGAGEINLLLFILPLSVHRAVISLSPVSDGCDNNPPPVTVNASLNPNRVSISPLSFLSFLFFFFLGNLILFCIISLTSSQFPALPPVLRFKRPGLAPGLVQEQAATTARHMRLAFSLFHYLTPTAHFHFFVNFVRPQPPGCILCPKIKFPPGNHFSKHMRERNQEGALNIETDPLIV